MPDATPEQITAFISRWENSGAAERANYQMFLSELCGIIGVPRPDPTSPDPAKNLHVFDRAITRTHLDGTATTNYIDLYKARHFVCETKQGLSADASPEELAKPAATKSGHGKRGTLAFDKALERAYHQARGYITALPAEEGRPPFLIVCDVGHSIDLYAAATDWSAVEPSIFGTLLTRALDSRERHKLGAEYTPRSYVERLNRRIPEMLIYLSCHKDVQTSLLRHATSYTPVQETGNSSRRHHPCARRGNQPLNFQANPRKGMLGNRGNPTLIRQILPSE